MNDVLKLLDQTVRYIHATGFTDSAHVRYDGRGIHDEARYVSIPFEECPDPVCSEARTLLAAPSPALTRDQLTQTEFENRCGDAVCEELRLRAALACLQPPKGVPHNAYAVALFSAVEPNENPSAGDKGSTERDARRFFTHDEAGDVYTDLPTESPLTSTSAPELGLRQQVVDLLATNPGTEDRGFNAGVMEALKIIDTHHREVIDAFMRMGGRTVRRPYLEGWRFSGEAPKEI